MRQPSCFARSAGIRPGRAIANHTDTLGPAPDRGPQARNLLERRQHLIQTLITHGLVVGPHVTISITGFSQKLPTEQREGRGRRSERRRWSSKDLGPRLVNGQNDVALILKCFTLRRLPHGQLSTIKANAVCAPLPFPFSEKTRSWLGHTYR